MSRVSNYIVEGKKEGSCGGYSMITALNKAYPKWGYNSLIADRGYKKGDEIEECMDEFGNCLWVKKNGVLIYERDEKKEQEEHDNYMRRMLQSKGIKHKIYNP